VHILCISNDKKQDVVKNDVGIIDFFSVRSGVLNGALVVCNFYGYFL